MGKCGASVGSAGCRRWNVVLSDYAVSVSSAATGSGEEDVGELPFVAPGIGRCHGDLDTPDAGRDERANFEQT